MKLNLLQKVLSSILINGLLESVWSMTTFSSLSSTISTPIVHSFPLIAKPLGQAQAFEIKVIDDNQNNNNENNSTEKFSCYDRTYGYYADIQSDCKKFFLCYPEFADDGKDNELQTQQRQLTYHRIPFHCAPNEMFNQKELICVDRKHSSLDCGESVNYFQESSDRVAELVMKSMSRIFDDGNETGKSIRTTTTSPKIRKQRRRRINKKDPRSEAKSVTTNKSI